MAGERLIESAQSLKRIMGRYYAEAHQRAAAGGFVVWPAIIVPLELLRGFDLVVAVPENHSAMCAARGVGAEQAQKAEAMGYSMDLCSYARIDIGAAFSGGEGSPSRGLPRPDLIISNNDNCSLLVKWFDIYRREWGTPHFVLDVPFCYEPQQEKDVDYIVHQFRDLIRLIEELTGQRFDLDRVRAAMDCTNRAVAHWKRFLGFAARRPAGITAFDSFVHMAPYITAWRGAPELVEHYKLLADETEAQVAEGLFPVPNEKHRLLWDNIAPWHQLRKMSSRLAELDANIIYASYTSCLGSLEGEIDAFVFQDPDPLRDLARIQNSSVCPSGLELRFRAMGRMIERFKPNGVVFSSNKSCKVYSLMQMDLMRMIKEEYGLPAVMIDVDHADPRQYSESKAFIALEALLERIHAA